MATLPKMPVLAQKRAQTRRGRVSGPSAPLHPGARPFAFAAIHDTTRAKIRV